jgi:hypothetical protein
VWVRAPPVSPYKNTLSDLALTLKRCKGKTSKVAAVNECVSIWLVIEDVIETGLLVTVNVMTGCYEVPTIALTGDDTDTILKHVHHWLSVIRDW